MRCSFDLPASQISFHSHPLGSRDEPVSCSSAGMAVLHMTMPGILAVRSLFLRKEETLQSPWEQAFQLKPGEVTAARSGVWTHRL